MTVASFSADEILYATQGRVASGTVGSLPGKLAWNLEDISRGDWFVAMPCGAEDGHDFIAEAIELGAQGCIVNPRSRYALAPADAALIAVADTRIAILELAKYWRYKACDKVVAVTGTVGRKATISFLEFLLRKKYQIHTALERNGMSCIPDLLSMPKGTDLLIAELGGLERGDIARIGSRLAPDLAVITTTHHPLSSPEKDARAAALNCEILETIRDISCGFAVVYDRNPAVKERAQLLSKGLRSVFYTGDSGKVSESEITRLTKSKVETEERVEADAWCALAAAKCLGLSFEDNREIIEEVAVDTAWMT